MILEIELVPWCDERGEGFKVRRRISPMQSEWMYLSPGIAGNQAVIEMCGSESFGFVWRTREQALRDCIPSSSIYPVEIVSHAV